MRFSVTKVSPLENFLNKIEMLNVVVAKADVIENIIKRIDTLEPVLARLLSLEGRPIELEAPSRVDPSGTFSTLTINTFKHLFDPKPSLV